MAKTAAIVSTVIRQRGPGSATGEEALQAGDAGVALVVDHRPRRARAPTGAPTTAPTRPATRRRRTVDQVVLGAVRPRVQQRGAEVAGEARGHLEHVLGPPLEGLPLVGAHHAGHGHGDRLGGRSRQSAPNRARSRRGTLTPAAARGRRPSSRLSGVSHPAEQAPIGGRGHWTRARGRHRLAGRPADEHRAGRRDPAPGRVPASRSWPPSTSPARRSARSCPAASTC